MNSRTALTPGAANACVQQHFASTDPALWPADPDGDGVANLLEYALATTPTSSGSASLPSASLTPSLPHSLQLTFLRARSDVTYEVLASSDLVSWNIIATNPGSVSLTTPVTVTDTADLTTTPRRFLRLRVTIP